MHHDKWMSIVMNKPARDPAIDARTRRRVGGLPGKVPSSRQERPLEETAMRATTRPFLLCAALAIAAGAGGCAAPQTGPAAYEQALSQWQGASEDTLRARWGKPVAEEQIGSGKWLTYVVNAGAVPPPTVTFSIGGFGFGGAHTSVGGGVGVTTPVGQATPITCTTRFLIENGKVSTWTFDGQGCGT
jgi:hypothetical protein